MKKGDEASPSIMLDSQALLVKMFITLEQGWDKYCPAGKFQWKMPDNAGTANTPKITEVANTGTYEQN